MKDVIERNMNKSQADLEILYNNVRTASKIKEDASKRYAESLDDFTEASRQFLSRFLMDTSEENPYICDDGWEILENPMRPITLISMWQDPSEGILYFKIKEITITSSKQYIKEYITEFDDLTINEIIQIIKLI